MCIRDSCYAACRTGLSLAAALSPAAPSAVLASALAVAALARFARCRAAAARRAARARRPLLLRLRLRRRRCSLRLSPSLPRLASLAVVPLLRSVPHGLIASAAALPSAAPSAVLASALAVAALARFARCRAAAAQRAARAHRPLLLCLRLRRRLCSLRLSPSLPCLASLAVVPLLRSVPHLSLIHISEPTRPY